jgi:hypothetical protein
MAKIIYNRRVLFLTARGRKRTAIRTFPDDECAGELVAPDIFTADAIESATANVTKPLCEIFMTQFAIKNASALYGQCFGTMAT